MKMLCKLLTVGSLLFFFACSSGGGTLVTKNIEGTSGSLTIKGEVWADNWFALYLGDKLLIERIPSRLQRSVHLMQNRLRLRLINPLVLNFVVKDFKENDTGLEYIGANNQQMGDGGFIAQFKDNASGKVLAATNAKWKCMVIHEAPLDTACEKSASPKEGEAPCKSKVAKEPSGWKAATYDDKSWGAAKEYSNAEVSPKDGYDQVTWDSAAKLIWTGNLKTHNTILCRIKIEKP